MIYFLIGVGAFFGAISRYLLSGYLEKLLLLGFPLGTVIINLIGCYLIGVFLAFNLSNKDLIGPLIAIGYLSSFTTFSAFTKEVLLFSNSNGWMPSIFIAIIISSLCVFSTFMGHKMFS